MGTKVSGLAELLAAAKVRASVGLVLLMHVQVVKELVHVVGRVVALQCALLVQVFLADQQAGVFCTEHRVLEVIKIVILDQRHCSLKAEERGLEVSTTYDGYILVIRDTELVQLVSGHQLIPFVSNQPLHFLNVSFNRFFSRVTVCFIASLPPFQLVRIIVYNNLN